MPQQQQRPQQHQPRHHQQQFQWSNDTFVQQDDHNQPSINYSYQVFGNQMPANIQIQFQSIFGPNGVFTQSMNQVNQIFSNVNVQVNNSNRRHNAPIIQFNHYYTEEPDYEEEDDEEQEENEYEYDYQEEEEEEVGMSELEIANLPTGMYGGTQKHGYGLCNTLSTKSCVVCMTDFRKYEAVKTLKCCHNFHVECIDNWLRQKPQCPVCRYDQRE